LNKTYYAIWELQGNPSISTISAPSLITTGGKLSLSSLSIDANGSTVTDYGWQYSADGVSNWTSFAVSTKTFSLS